MKLWTFAALFMIGCGGSDLALEGAGDAQENDCLRFDPLRNYRHLGEQAEVCLVYEPSNSNQDELLYQTLLDAAADWEHCGMVKFKIRRGTDRHWFETPVNIVPRPAGGGLGVMVWSDADITPGNISDRFQIQLENNQIFNPHTFRHELGHRLGFQHMTDTIMMPSVTVDTMQTSLSEFDCKLVQARFGIPEHG